MKSNHPKLKIKIQVTIVETKPGKHSVGYAIDEVDANMKEVALAIYKLKQIEQEFINRKWGGCEDGYEIEQTD